MKRIFSKPAIAAVAVLLVFGSTAWWLRSRTAHPAGSGPSGSMPAAAPPNPAHERAALIDQLAKAPGHPPVLLRLAQIDHEGGKTAEARQWLEQLLAADPGNLDGLLELGRVCYDSGDIACAEARTRAILDKNPAHVDALYNLGAMSANQGRTEDARNYWTRAIQSAPQSESGRKADQGLKTLLGQAAR